MLGLFKRKPKPSENPFDGPEAAAAWLAASLDNEGPAAHATVARRIQTWKRAGACPGKPQLDALFVLYQGSWALHQQLMGNVLLNTRMPEALENDLREKSLEWSSAFLSVLIPLTHLPASSEERQWLAPSLPLVSVLTLTLLAEQARWRYMRHLEPDSAFWRTLHKTYAHSEAAGFAGQDVVLNDGEPPTTVEDLYLGILMLSLLPYGSLTTLQLDAAWQVLQELSTRMSLIRRRDAWSSFEVRLGGDRPAMRPSDDGASAMSRYWTTEVLSEELQEWLALLESGRPLPDSIMRRPRGLDAGVLRILLRSWAPQVVRIDRAARTGDDGQVDLIHRLPAIHAVLREQEDEHGDDAGEESKGFDRAVDLRVYGFVTHRAPERVVQEKPRVAGPLVVRADIDNVSRSGIGLELSEEGQEWLAAGRLVAFRRLSESMWALGIIRRIKRKEGGRCFLGIETIGDQAIAASLRPTDQRMVEAGLPTEHVWRNGMIAIHLPSHGPEQSGSRLIMPSAWCVPDRPFFMDVRGKTIQLTLGRMIESGSDWALVDLVDVTPPAT
ncbi:hypothetical protein [Paludibacterium paludis]|uniref:PilZ domain-containing protein n=1 Tax=Paludibacterium paludis TaxID=1225769 RepID=A0A918NYV9_9NEIS|nr:hypothetical protein [Paludibacterium paludis]GGY07235.1 hypothetical protein GCM10011289_07320 [Paludibacterium paludis]